MGRITSRSYAAERASTTRSELVLPLEIDSSLKKLPINKRFSDFVVIPCLPGSIPERQTQDRELIGMGESTIRMLRRQNKNVCPRVIFLAPFGCKLDPIYSTHLFQHYERSIREEKQFPLTIHIAAHGNPTGVGSPDMQVWINADDLAQRLLNSTKDLLSLPKRPAQVVFHCCNSAYVESAQTLLEAKESVMKNTFIGKFWQAIARQQTAVRVTGYRGYYTPVMGGAIVKEEYCSQTGIAAQKAEYCISAEGQISLPAANTLEQLLFPVQGVVTDWSPTDTNALASSAQLSCVFFNKQSAADASSAAPQPSASPRSAGSS